MSTGTTIPLDCVIFGGGVAGLWLLDELVRAGRDCLLLEAGDLGAGQTIASQGILHSGLKYTLQGLLTPAAEQLREMPGVWRAALRGDRGPDLRGVRVRSEFCHLWRTDTLKSRLGMLGAQFGLRVTPETISNEQRPPILAGCPGVVARLDEQVLSPASLIENLAAPHRGRILKIDSGPDGVAFDVTGPGRVARLALRPAPDADWQHFEPRCVVLTAGAGNAALRSQMGLNPAAMQRRPLQMVLVRGPLPELNGHCVDGAQTRLTITSDRDDAGRTVWQIGGQIAEDGVGLEPLNLLRHAQRELAAVLPALSTAGLEWSTYQVDRAEQATANGKRPDTAQLLHEGNVITAWPTKLVLAPQLAGAVTRLIPPPHSAANTVTGAETILPEWPRPVVAVAPWNKSQTWEIVDDSRAGRAA